MSPLEILAIVAALIGGPLFFVGLWVGVCWLLALVGGWSGLAKRYATDKPEPFGAESVNAMLGVTSYRGVLSVGFAEDGLDLRTMMLFRAGHPPLRIPWAEVRVEGEGPWMLFGRATSLRLGAGGPVLRLPSKVWARAQSVRPG